MVCDFHGSEINLYVFHIHQTQILHSCMTHSNSYCTYLVTHHLIPTLLDTSCFFSLSVIATLAKNHNLLAVILAPPWDTH